MKRSMKRTKMRIRMNRTMNNIKMRESRMKGRKSKRKKC